jgi:transposase-like protein
VSAQAEHSRFVNVLRLLLNEAMRLERAAALQAQPYERTVERRGYANGYKPKTLATRLGEMELRVPQVRGDVEFYPSALERGLRSERALKLAIAEMYVQGVSTRKVTQILEQLCGLNISSTQVSRCAALLDRSAG